MSCAEPISTQARFDALTLSILLLLLLAFAHLLPKAALPSFPDPFVRAAARLARFAADSAPSAPGTPVRANGYAYDGAGNRTYDDKSGVITRPTFDGLNRLQGDGYNLNEDMVTYQYNGATYNCTYNALDQLLSVTGAGQSVSFVYDPLGRLCQRTVNGVVTNLYYTGSQLVEERDANNNRTCSYTYGQGGERVCRLDANYQGTFYQYDARGYVTHLTDFGGAVDEQYLYDAFGQPYVYDKTGTVYRGAASQVANNRFVWAGGYEWYPEIGLYRCGARFYSPTIGRFLQPDPIGQAGGLNLYAYCGNDPINGADPSGLDATTQPIPGVVYNYGSNDQYSGYERLDGGWVDTTPGHADGSVTTNGPNPGTELHQTQTADGTWTLPVPGEISGGSSGSGSGGGESGGSGGGTGTRMYPVGGGHSDFAQAVVRNMAGGTPVGDSLGTMIKVNTVVANVVSSFVNPGEAVAEVGMAAERIGTVAAESGVQLSEKGLSLVEGHLATFEADAGNAAMMGRLRSAFASGSKVTGADANFYLHEASEATMVGRGMSQPAAHAAALEKYGVSPFSIYHPEVIQANPEIFGTGFKNYWGLGQ